MGRREREGGRDSELREDRGEGRRERHERESEEDDGQGQIVSEVSVESESFRVSHVPYRTRHSFCSSGLWASCCRYRCVASAQDGNDAGIGTDRRVTHAPLNLSYGMIRSVRRRSNRSKNESSVAW